MVNNILNKYLNNEKSGKITEYSLAGISELLRHLNNPHRNFKSLHIAGTNGKGSTAFMLSKILEKSGYKTGLFTSPHLLKINERIKINSVDINDEIFFNYINRIERIISNKLSFSPTYFDIITAAAFTYFFDESVDIAIIETGLGGRLDSTNVVIPEISIITDISMDHENILGDTIADITKEKCGIIKQSVPVITSNSNYEIVSIIDDYSVRNKTKLYAYNRDFNTSNIKRDTDFFVFDYISENHKILNIKLPLFPIHQVKNAASVITALIHLKSNHFHEISDDHICRELEYIKIPGRFQTLNLDPLIIYDPAHNFDSLNNLIEGLEKFYPEKNKIFVMSLMKDKVNHETMNLLKDSEVIYLTLNDERAYIPEDNQFTKVTSDLNIIIEILKQEIHNNKMIIFTGTFRIYNHAVFFSNLFQKAE